MKVYLYTDGSAKISREAFGVKTPKGARGHSGPGTWSYVIRSRSHGNEILDFGGGVLEDTTVPEAECSAIIGGLAACQRLDYHDVIVRCDAQLVVNQVTGKFAVRAAHLMDYYNEIKKMSEWFTNFKIEWVPRTSNHMADQIGREIEKEIINGISN